MHSPSSLETETCFELRADCCAISIRRFFCLLQPFVLNLTKIFLLSTGTFEPSISTDGTGTHRRCNRFTLFVGALQWNPIELLECQSLGIGKSKLERVKCATTRLYVVLIGIFFFVISQLIQKLLMPPLSSRTSDVLNVEPYYTKEYISRCRVRALRHFPNEKRMQSATFGFDTEFNVPDWKECISDKSNLNHHLPYRKPHKTIRNSRKSRRKHQCENDASDALHRIMDLDRLANAITHTVTDTIDVRFKDLLARVQFEIFKHKSKIASRAKYEEKIN